MADKTIPPLPAGFVLDSSAPTDVPPLPPSFTLDASQAPASEFSPAAIKRGAGLAARTVVQGASDIPLLPYDLTASIYNAGLALKNKFLGAKPYTVTLDDGTKRVVSPQEQFLPTASEQRDQSLTAIGLPEPATPAERVLNVASRAGMGAAGTARAAASLPGPIAQALAQRPALQTVSGLTGGASAATAKELGAGPVGQFVAGAAGALVPAVLAPRVPVAPGVPSEPGLTAPQARIAEAGKKIGMQLTPGQATGSKALQQVEARLESQPMTSAPFSAIKANNARVLTREWARAIGETNADTLDDAVLGRAKDRISGAYESVADDVPRTIEPKSFIDFFSQLQSDTRGLVKGLSDHPLIADTIKFAEEGQATGKQLQNLASKLGKAANGQLSSPSGDRELGLALFRAKDYVDELLAQGLSPQRGEAFANARQQYRNLILLTQRSGVINPSTGVVNGRSLASLLQSKDKRGFLFGENQTPAYTATRFAQAFAPIIGDSGTATRMPFMSLTDLALRAPLGIASRVYASRPGISVAARTQRALHAPRAYARGLLTPFQPYDLPAAGVLGEYATQ